MNKIIIKGLKVFAYHGVNSEEKEDGQFFVLDIIANVDIEKAGLSDKLDDTVSYAKIIKTAKREMIAEKNDLIERVAMRVGQAILEDFLDVSQLTITLKKPNAPINAEFEYVAVELSLGRSDI